MSVIRTNNKPAPGDVVRCAYRGDHRGTVLDEDDPRAWAGSIAFPGEPEPTRSAVREHLSRVRAMFKLAGRDYDGDPCVPVLWFTFPAPRVYWDTELTVVSKNLRTA